ncbi:MAG: hypothetical protein KDD42_08620 [Bdellovibrionales bacterium]|nr:hypothetical protein [Bdellovibrionales bacterium]
MSWVKKVDHIAYVCAPGMIEKWAWYHTVVEGGKMITRIDDTDPSNPDSSMKIWCIDFGTFGIALVEGIDRNKKSQVTAFVEKHGDHSVQHVAYDTKDLEGFINHLQKYNVYPRGEIYTRNDGFGMLKQVFCKGYDKLDPAEMCFPEYVERPKKNEDPADANITFSQDAGKTFYRQIEEAREKDDRSTFIDFSVMPNDWRPPIDDGTKAANA